MVILLTFTALIPGFKMRTRLILLESLIFALLVMAPWSLTRDVPQYKEIFENSLAISSFPEIFVRFMLAACFIGNLEIMFRSGFSIGSIITFIFLAIPTVAANQLRLSLAILAMLLLAKYSKGIISTMVGTLIHQSLALNLFIPQKSESRANYSARLFVLAGFCIIALTNMENIINVLLPYLGNVGTYLNAKEISDIYDETNYLQGIEFPLFFLFVSFQARSAWPLVVVGIAFVIAKTLTDLPTVMTMRFFELFCLLYLFSYLRALKPRTIPIIMFGIILLARLYLHYSLTPELN